MDTDHLTVFVAVYRAGGFAPVARDLGLAPSSISRAVAGLEEALQVRLFQRTTRKLEPTEAGTAFFQRVQPLVEELEAACADARDTAGEPAGRLRVTASVSYGQICLVPRLKPFRALFPRIALDLILSDAALDLLSERIDLAIRHGPLADSSLIASRLAPVRYHVVASPEYLAAAEPIRRPADISSHPCVAFSYEGFRSCWQFRRGRTTAAIDITPAVTVSNAAAIRQCAVNGLGLALLADWTIAADMDAGRLVDVLPDHQAAGASFDTSIWLVYPSRSFIPKRARAFADFLKQDVHDRGRAAS